MPRPKIPHLLLSTGAALYIFFVLNATLWSRAHEAFAADTPRFATFLAVFAAVLVAICAPFSVKYVMKPVLILLILIAATSAYFSDTYGIAITRGVLSDVLETTRDEAGGFFSWHLLLNIGLFGVLPSLLVAWVRVAYPSPLRTLGANALTFFGALGIGAGLSSLTFASPLAVFVGHPDLIQRANPVGPVAAAIQYGSRRLKQRDVQLRPIGTDARRGTVDAVAGRPIVTVVVVGESLRAQNFGLDGYERDTTPELRAADVISYAQATSCGTSTSISVPCMFSQDGRSGFSESKARSTENLLDVLKHAGVASIWWDNQTGSKGVADRVEFHNALRSPADCPSGECFDEALVKSLKVSLDAVKDDTVIVLHQHGSHGPLYDERHPVAFRHFLPVCMTPHLADCSRQEIVNAYDNTVLYTDHVLAEIIQELRSREDRMDGAMVYLSDHGESLGENGLYMHAAPYMFAPSQQTHIPFVVWISPGLAKAEAIDLACLRGRRDVPVSQDNLFHSVLGLMDVTTTVRDPAKDVFAPCRERLKAG